MSTQIIAQNMTEIYDESRKVTIPPTIQEIIGDNRHGLRKGDVVKYVVKNNGEIIFEKVNGEEKERSGEGVLVEKTSTTYRDGGLTSIPSTIGDMMGGLQEGDELSFTVKSDGEITVEKK